jgi:hypothetical protein
VSPVYGETYELPNKITNYRMLQGDNIIVNASTRAITLREGEEIKEYYLNCTGNEAPPDLLTKGVFYEKVYINSEGEELVYDFDTKKGSYSSGYFKITQETSKNKKVVDYESSLMVTQVYITFKNAQYGSMRLTLNNFSNPQIKYGIGLDIVYPQDLTGLLIREYESKSLECNSLKSVENLSGVLSVNDSYSIIGSVGNNTFRFPLYAEKTILPKEETTFRLLYGKDLKITAEIRQLTDKELMEKEIYYLGNLGKIPIEINNVCYKNINIFSNGEKLEYDFDKQCGTISSSSYFKLNKKVYKNKKLNLSETSSFITNVCVSFKHKMYGLVCLDLNTYSNPRIKNDIALKRLTGGNVKGLSGLLMVENKCKRINVKKN